MPESTYYYTCGMIVWDLLGRIELFSWRWFAASLICAIVTDLGGELFYKKEKR